jgi:uncharacterized protein YajQ (UPF0234 family)
MPSFDVVSEIDIHELNNAIDQANREVGNRYDFKGSDSKFEYAENVISMETGTEFQLQQMLDVFYSKASKRGIDLESFEVGEAEERGKRAYQKITVKQGIDKEIGKKIVKKIKDEKMKVQASIQGDQVRVTGKKRDDLQQAISMLKEAGMGIPLQFQNFRD